MDTTPAASRFDRIKPVIQVGSGNFLEMYDFFVFAYYAAEIGRTYFPTTSGFASLMLSLATFGVGYLMRPLGAVVLGGYIVRPVVVDRRVLLHGHNNSSVSWIFT